MAFRLGSRVLMAAACLHSWAQIGPVPAGTLLVRLEWTQLNPGPPLTNSDYCALVYQSGHMHIEVRRQQIPAPSPTVKVLSLELNQSGVIQLRAMLDAEEIQHLPTFVPFGVPGNISVRQAFLVDIARDGAIQHVGYERWRSAAPVDSHEPASTALEHSQEPAIVALEPLHNWFLALDSRQMQRSDEPPTLCKDVE